MNSHLLFEMICTIYVTCNNSTIFLMAVGVLLTCKKLQVTRVCLRLQAHVMTNARLVGCTRQRPLDQSSRAGGLDSATSTPNKLPAQLGIMQL